MRIRVVLVATTLALFAGGAVWAQDQQADNAPQQQLLDAAQLDQLVAPIALYPDPLLAQVLMASTYPLEVVQADRFAKANKGLKGDKLTEALDKQDWDPSVKQLVSTPTVLDMMNDKLDWTEKLGDAVLAQQADVMGAIQRLRTKAQANGKLETTKQQKVTVDQQGEKPVIVIEPASPDAVYVPYYNPTVVYGPWPYPEYPPYYYPPPPGYVVGGAIARGLAWGAAFAIGHEIWDNFDWRHGNINVDINRNVNVERNFNKWEHNSYHRRGVSYNNEAVRNKFAGANARPTDRKLDYRGRSGKQVLNVPKGKPGAPGGPNLRGKPGTKPNVAEIQKGLKERPGQKPGPGKAKPKRPSGGNAFDLSDGAKARDFSKRGQASLGNRGATQFSRPSGGGPKARSGGRPAHVGGGGRGGGANISRGGGGRGRGGGGRRSDIRLKEDIVPLMQLSNGLELYRFRYKGSDHTAYVGVMAQEVQKVDPSAVWRDRDGYLRVNYDQIGVEFMTWKEWLVRKGPGHSSLPWSEQR
jgi:hypothetical protein